MRALSAGSLLLLLPLTAVATLADASAPGRVVFEVRPERARVSVDGVEVGRVGDYDGTWDRLAVRPGLRVLELSARGFRTVRVELDVAPGGRYRITERLPLLREGDESVSETPSTPPASSRDGRLRLHVSPADAAVYLDGEFLARAGELRRLHAALPLAEGSHHVEAVSPGHRSKSLDIDVRAARAAEVRITLERNDP